MGLGEWWSETSAELQSDLNDIGDRMRGGYNAAADAAAAQRAALMGEIEEISPGLARALRATDRAFGVIEHGIQSGVVEIGAGTVGIAGDLVLNNGYEYLTGAKLYNGSAENWTRDHLNGAIDGAQEILSLGADKPLTDLGPTEQKISDVFSIATQLAMPATTFAGGLVKGRNLLQATRAARMVNPEAGLLRNFFDDAVHFSQHPFRSTQQAISFTSSSNNSLHLGYQLGGEALQLATPGH